MYATKVDLLYMINTSHLKQETILHEYPLLRVLCPHRKEKKKHPTTEHWSLVIQSSSMVASLTTETNL
jgi:hypothetical protein